MTIPFDDASPESANCVSVAWLRIIKESDGRGVRGALFQTTPEGEPLDFCFARIDRRDAAGRRTSNAQVPLARSLFQAAASPPSLIVARADELPPGALSGVRLLLCRVEFPACGARDGPELPPQAVRPFQLLWDGDDPGEGSTACQLLSGMAAEDHPFEAMDRAAKGLTEAFSDDRVRGMMGVSGLQTVISLLSLQRREEDPDAYPSTPPAAGQTQTTVTRRSFTLAERLRAVLAPPKPRRDPRLDWPGELMPFQRDGVRALMDSSRLLLADDMGLGKTLQAIAALRILRARREIGPCLVAAPASILDQWRREVAKWAPELSAIIIRGPSSDRSWQWAADRDVTLVSYDTLRSDFHGNPHSPVRQKTWDVVVADEAQRIKNRNDTSLALKGLRRTRSWALTGTPIENHEEEAGFDPGVRRLRWLRRGQAISTGRGVAVPAPPAAAQTKEERGSRRLASEADCQSEH